MLQDVIGLSLFKEVSAVLIIFGFVEIVFFIFIRSLYMQKIITIHEWTKYLKQT